jgi:N-acetylmuramoyl-L-alanine amidase
MQWFKPNLRYWSILIIISVLITGTVMYFNEQEIKRQAEASFSEAMFALGSGTPRSGDLWTLARLVSGEAKGEPYIGQVAVAAVIINRVRSPKFPASVSGVVYQPKAFESVSNGEIWRHPPNTNNIKAARQALNGWDPTYGALFFWNPYKPVSRWIWTRRIITQIGRHVFGL